MCRIKIIKMKATQDVLYSEILILTMEAEIAIKFTFSKWFQSKLGEITGVKTN